MRYLLDTNILVYSIIDRDSLCTDVKEEILSDYDNSFYISAETVKELIVLFRNGRIGSRIWKTAKEMVDSISYDYFITVLPVDNEVMKTYSSLNINENENHNDPSDHVIISQAITLKIPLISSDRKFAFYERQGLDFVYNHK